MSSLPFNTGEVASLHVEYGGLECNVEVVDSVSDAIHHINSYGSSHTDAIVTENGTYYYICIVVTVCMFITSTCSTILDWI